MKYSVVGRDGLRVSKIALGTWSFGSVRAWGESRIEDLRKVVDYALDNGVNFIDTAEGYGSSEEILGELLKGYEREDIVLATKVGGKRFDYETVKARLLRSLKRLQTDYVDLYQIHWPKMKHLWHGEDMTEKDYLDIYDSMQKLREEGLIRYGGLSNFRLHHLKMFPEEAFKVLVTNQVPYSLVWRFYEVEGVTDYCRARGMRFLAYSPLAQGLLTGRFKPGGKPLYPTQKANILFNEPVFSRAWRVVEEVIRVAEELDVKPAQVALRWVLEQDIVASAIVGTRSVEHLRENIEAVELNIPRQYLDMLNKASLEFQSTLPLGLEMWIGNNRPEVLEKIGIKK